MTSSFTTSRFTLDRSVRRVGGGQVVVGGSPLTLFRLTEAGARLLDRIGNGEAVEQIGSAGHLIDRFVASGLVHPLPEPLPDPPAVTVVIPAYRASPDVSAPPNLAAPADLVALVAASHAAAAVVAVVVVDDASPTPIPPIAGATVARHDTNQGPGAARSTGAALAATPLVAFVDTDVVLTDGWLEPLLAHFADDRVALVAPRVARAAGSSLIARYERSRSPLDLGDQPARVRAGTRVSYVPSAAVVVRLDALRSVGGFDQTMRVGEDVDVVWRLDEAGFGVRYEPASTVHHRPRASVRGWLRQRFDYGSSAAPLARRHVGALAPVRVSGWSTAAWVAAVAGRPVVGGAIAAATTALLARKLRDVPDGRILALRLGGLGHLYAGRSLASGVTRAWWPVAAAASILSRRARRAVVLCAVAPSLIDWFRTRPDLRPDAYLALRLLDDLAYGSGLASGMLAERSLAAARPDLSSWPGARHSNARRSAAR